MADQNPRVLAGRCDISIFTELYKAWMQLMDIMGEARLWPKFVRRAFWTVKIKHWDLVRQCAFVYINGCNSCFLMAWMRLRKMDQKDILDAERLFKTFETDPKRYTLYSWNVSQGTYMYLDGTRHTYTNRQQSDRTPVKS